MALFNRLLLPRCLSACDSAKDDAVQKRISAEPIPSVHASSHLSCSKEPFDGPPISC